MARTIEFGENPDERRVIEEDGTAELAPAALESTELARVPAPAVSKTSARAAANLRYAGAPYDEIARLLDYRDAATARRVVEEAIARAYPDESRESLFRIASARLEALAYKLNAKTEALIPERDDRGRIVKDAEGKPVMRENPEQLAYVKAVADLTTRWTRLHGLEAPTQVQITPNAEAFDKVIASARDRMLAGSAPEADIFGDVEDAELVEDAEEGELDG